MKKLFTLSLALSSALMASEIMIEKITVRGESEKSLKDAISSEEIKFTNKIDIAQILSNSYPEISTVRKTGAAGDISMRGFYKDDVRVTVDGQAIHCACPNRMDPPTYHLSAENVQKVEVIEGPFDVASPGALAGSINIVSKAPKEGVSGSVNAGYGSFDFQKLDANLNAGSKTVKAQVGYTKEKMGQYKDGSGSSMYEVNYVDTALTAAQNAKKYRNDINIKDKDAFEKQSYFAKLTFTPTENHEVYLSYFADRPDTILYPSLGMDSFKDDTDMYTIGYKAKKLGSLSDEFEVSAYNNEVKHDMRTDYRDNRSTGNTIFSYYVESKTDGLKAENTANLSGHLIKIGADYYKRVWDAKNYSNYATQTLATATVPYPLAEVTTKNYGLYGKLAKTYGDLSVDAGIRYDISKMELDEDKVRVATAANKTEILANPDDSWNNFSGSIMAKYGIGSGYVYAGYGHTVRLPDGAEKYHLNVHNRRGNAGLKPTINNEVDAGYAYAKDGIALKVNTFYSKLQDYIYMYRTGTTTVQGPFTYDNVDATMYGWDVSGAYSHESGLSLELGVAQTFGKKETKKVYDGGTGIQLNDKELRNIPPLKARVAAKYEMGRFSSQAEWIAAAGQKATDSDGSQPEESTAGWAVVNLKAGYEFAKGWSAWVGVDNLFNKNYYIHGSNSNMLFISNQPNIHLNEPGRFVYANLGYKF